MATIPGLEDDDLAHCMAMVREQANDFYLADLLLSEVQRPAAFVLHAFHVEAVNIALGTNEPMAGEIRLQWWHEVLAGQREGETHGHPLARALRSVIEHYSLPVKALQAKLDAHVFDLYSNPMENQTMLEGWCGETRSVLFQLVAMSGGAEQNSNLADACGYAGVSTGIVSVLENMAMHRAKRQIYIPDEILANAGLDAEKFLAELELGHQTVCRSMIDLARQRHDDARKAINVLDKDLTPTFGPLNLVPIYLSRAEKRLSDIPLGLPPVPQWRKQWKLWRIR